MELTTTFQSGTDDMMSNNKVNHSELIKHVCSLGLFCHTSFIRKRNNLKQESYPFDWIFSDLSNVIHCIENNFKIFLDKSYYVSIRETACGHTFYNNRMWWHHNPLINEADYAYNIRCILRFKKLLLKIERKLFIVMFVNQDSNNVNENIKDQVIEFNNKFKIYSNNYTLLCIIQYSNKNKNNYTCTNVENVDFLELDTISKSNGVVFENENDNIFLDQIFKDKYNL